MCIRDSFCPGAVGYTRARRLRGQARDSRAGSTVAGGSAAAVYIFRRRLHLRRSHANTSDDSHVAAAGGDLSLHVDGKAASMAFGLVQSGWANDRRYRDHLQICTGGGNARSARHVDPQWYLCRLAYDSVGPGRGLGPFATAIDSSQAIDVYAPPQSSPVRKKMPVSYTHLTLPTILRV